MRVLTTFTRSTCCCVIITSFLLMVTLMEPVQSFIPGPPIISSKTPISKRRVPPSSVVGVPRGGDHTINSSSSSTSLALAASLPLAVSQVTDIISSSLQSGPFGILALSAVTWSVVLPLTIYKKIYGIGVAYGFSVCFAGYTMLHVFSGLDPTSAGSLLAKACMLYGARLGGYLLLRSSIRDESSSTVKNGSIQSRVLFSLSLSLFYALLTTPVLYACRDLTTPSTPLAVTGASLAFVGAILEAVADFHKLVRKSLWGKPAAASSSSSSSTKDGTLFIGPTTWTYRICRHPNYLGEILMWTGLFMGGLPSFGSSIPAWVASSLGVFGIVSIMTKATQGLEKRQAEKYGGQKEYEDWKEAVKAPLIPFITK